MTKVINLSDLKKDPEVKLVVGEVEHVMQPATVNSFIEHMKMVEDLGTNASLAEEMEVMIKIIIGAFPTLTDDEVRQWPLSYIQQINDVVQSNAGTAATQDEEKAEEAEKTGNGSTAT